MDPLVAFSSTPPPLQTDFLDLGLYRNLRVTQRYGPM